MFRPAVRRAASAVRPPHTALHASRSRFLSTAPPHQRSRTWKSTLSRWGLAGAAVYYYNTSTAFADESEYATHAPPQIAQENEEGYETIDEISKARKEAKAAAKEAKTAASTSVADAGAVAGSPEELEEEADQQGAFNEETGEINWDCPCLGGMAHGPCGEQFREAFSCFIFSKEEPKGVDCIDKFKGMQDCFREHPDVYGSELEDEEDPDLVGEGGVGDVPPGAEAGVGEAKAGDAVAKPGNARVGDAEASPEGARAGDAVATPAGARAGDAVAQPNFAKAGDAEAGPGYVRAGNTVVRS